MLLSLLLSLVKLSTAALMAAVACLSVNGGRLYLCFIITAYAFVVIHSSLALDSDDVRSSHVSMSKYFSEAMAPIELMVTAESVESGEATIAMTSTKGLIPCSCCLSSGRMCHGHH